MIASLLACLYLSTGTADLFNGRDLTGWEQKAVHGGQGGRWWVEDGMICGDQDADHTGGLLGTTRAYGDFEIELEFRADDPVDSGLFLRTDEKGNAYQITLDIRPDGSVGCVYASGVGGFVFEQEEWRSVYRPGGWNRLKARIEGQPPRLRVWLNGARLVDWRDPQRRLPAEGYVGLQVHGGEGAWGEDNRIRYRSLRLTPIEPPDFDFHSKPFDK